MVNAATDLYCGEMNTADGETIRGRDAIEKSLAAQFREQPKAALRATVDSIRSLGKHTVVAEGAFGRLQFDIQGIPTQENPRTGRLVAMSVMRTLLLRRAPIAVG